MVVDHKVSTSTCSIPHQARPKYFLHAFIYPGLSSVLFMTYGCGGPRDYHQYRAIAFSDS